jgi:hypothetical protein
MAKVNNATGVYSTLGYGFSDPNKYVQPLSTDAQDHLNALPPFIEAWQAKDIANNTVNGYFQNPLAGDVSTIIDTSALIIVAANNIGESGLVTAADTLHTTATNFLDHTNRISGVTPYDPSDVVNPYYENASAYGKTAMYITNQTDGIVDSSPIMGSFTGILIGPQVKSAAAIVVADCNILVGSISGSSYTDPETGETTSTFTSSLSPGQIASIINDLNGVNTLLVNRQTEDITFFTNTKNMVNKYNTVKQFTNMGETQTYLINNFIGTPKLLSRINS